jgi:hypothetical protein
MPGTLVYDVARRQTTDLLPSQVASRTSGHTQVEFNSKGNLWASPLSESVVQILIGVR